MCENIPTVSLIPVEEILSQLHFFVYYFLRIKLWNSRDFATLRQAGIEKK